MQCSEIALVCRRQIVNVLVRLTTHAVTAIYTANIKIHTSQTDNVNTTYMLC